jgi:RNA polymerase sigma factor (TIGR02999 family)
MFVRLLRDYQGGDASKLNELSQLVYNDLRRIAAGLLKSEYRVGVSMQATMLASDSVMRLLAGSAIPLNDLPHFLAVAARTMRRILIDHARNKDAAKRPSSGQRVELRDDLALTEDERVEVLALHDALSKLEEEDPKQAEILTMHYFSGASVDEIAEHMAIASRTVKRRLDSGRLFLKAELAGR